MNHFTCAFTRVRARWELREKLFCEIQKMAVKFKICEKKSPRCPILQSTKEVYSNDYTGTKNGMENCYLPAGEKKEQWYEVGVQSSCYSISQLNKIIPEKLQNISEDQIKRLESLLENKVFPFLGFPVCFYTILFVFPSHTHIKLCLLIVF